MTSERIDVVARHCHIATGLAVSDLQPAHTVAAVVEDATGQNGGRAPEPELPGDGVGAF